MPESIPVPMSVGKYTVLRELGRGGMGVVYLAEDATLRRQVAVKMLLPQAARHANSRARFLREAQAMAAVRSANVITVHDVGEEDDRPYFVMELLSGYSLDKLIRGGSRLDLDQVIDLGIDFARGIADAHEKGVIHRDIKPANLFVEQPKNRGKVLDFGLTRLRESTELTAESSFMGTLLYMPLEQAKREPVDHRADIYSLGVVLYQLTAGRLPFEGETEYEVLYALAMTEPPRVGTLNPTVPPRFADLIHRMLSKDRAARPQTMEAVAEELDLIRGARSATKFPLVPTAILVSPVEKTEHQSGAPTKGPLAPFHAPTIAQSPEAKGKGWVWLLLIILLIVGGIVVKRFLIDLPWVGRSEGVAEFVKRSPDEPDLLDCSGLAGATPEEVRNRQQAWADHLKIPVETAVDLGGGLTMEFVLVPPGKYWMGATPEEHEAYLKSLGSDERRPESLGWDLPRHLVTLSRPFYVGKCEVTQQEYGQLTGLPNPSRFKPDPKAKAKGPIEPIPVDNVSWDDANHAAEAMKALTLPKGCSKATLPTEAQWEYACRAGTVTPFHFGAALDGALANCDAKYPFGSAVTRPFLGKTIPVRGVPANECGTHPNAFGLFQMHGNVMEWCRDGFDEGAYARHRPVDPVIGPCKQGFVLRGGAWSSPARSCRSAERFRNDRDEKNAIYGFRLVLLIE